MIRALMPLSIAALVAACASSSGSTSDAGRAARPNVVVVFVDDLGAGELGCYGQQHIQTPHIDSIARAGVRFNSAYTGSRSAPPLAASC